GGVHQYHHRPLGVRGPLQLPRREDWKPSIPCCSHRARVRGGVDADRARARPSRVDRRAPESHGDDGQSVSRKLSLATRAPTSVLPTLSGVRLFRPAMLSRIHSVTSHVMILPFLKISSAKGASSPLRRFLVSGLILLHRREFLLGPIRSLRHLY